MNIGDYFMFLENKYTKWYNNIIVRAKNQNRKKSKNLYYESHHTIPKSMGGIEEVLLTAKEHFVCHLLLCKMLVGNDKYKMINALIRMAFCKSKGQKRYTAKSYNLVRSLIAEKNREMFTGVPKSEETKNNMKGRCGLWKREEKHRERMRGKNNPMSGKCGILNPANKQETRKKISLAKLGNKCGVGNKSVSNMIWVNNGKQRKMVNPENIPEGYVKGKKMMENENAMG